MVTKMELLNRIERLEKRVDTNISYATKAWQALAAFLNIEVTEEKFVKEGICRDRVEIRYKIVKIKKSKCGGSKGGNE